ncbi:adenylyl-sulfate kinase [Umezawaea sp. Da 62-37]|uniref:adenylyl-sulfate kinase n=1 Tax=Umezawaea sp. Da 62-37 TaxID=3075927 RepID=UPI0028F72B59|nr:adenylyl-sulfate kinase [Umezawaea sp. Da 62-37]WNV92096.1 adenylyl-sulfate kinase [Umezawaea sp. Da 62-37]
MGAAPPGATAFVPGITVWLTGLPSAGKSTIADGVADRLRAAGHRVEVLDGDEVRSNLTRDLGFSRADREENVRRVGFVASLLARHGVVTLVPVIAPYASSRHRVRSGHAELGLDFVEAYVATPMSVCSARDVKGLYALQRGGGLTGLTGVDDPYEAPTDPDLVIPAHIQTPEESIDTVHAFLLTRVPR